MSDPDKIPHDGGGASETLSLQSLKVGQNAVVFDVEGDEDDPIRRRLSDLGFLRGTPIFVERRAPMGDPRVYVLRNYEMCLRKREAERVRVTLESTIEGAAQS